MQTATVMVRTSLLSVTKKTGVTPAEAALLKHMFHGSGGGEVIESVSDIEEVERTDEQELARLKRLYKKNVSELYQGFNPRLPQEFPGKAKVKVEAPEPVSEPEEVPVKEAKVKKSKIP